MKNTAIPIFLIVIGLVGTLKCEQKTAAPAAAPAPSQTKTAEPTHKTIRLELDAKRFLLKKRHNLDLVKGQPVQVVAENCPEDREYDYKEEMYVCVRNGIVVLLGYNIKGAVTSPSEALEAVGLVQFAGPKVIPGAPGVTVYLWKYEWGNPVLMGDKFIPAVRLIWDRRWRTIEIDMHGWKTIPGNA